MNKTSLLMKNGKSAGGNLRTPPSLFFPSANPLYSHNHFSGKGLHSYSPPAKKRPAAIFYLLFSRIHSKLNKSWVFGDLKVTAMVGASNYFREEIRLRLCLGRWIIWKEFG
jgi:hypothetical protein